MAKRFGTIYKFYKRAVDLWFEGGIVAVVRGAASYAKRGIVGIGSAHVRVKTPRKHHNQNRDYQAYLRHYGPSKFKLQSFLSQKGYELESAVEPGRVFKVIKENVPYALKLLTGRHYHMNRIVMQALANCEFKRMVVPTFIEGAENSEVGGWLVTSWEEGEPYSDRVVHTSVELEGGKMIEIDTVDMVLELISDLTSIDPHLFADAPVHRETTNSLFIAIDRAVEIIRSNSLLPEASLRRLSKLLQPIRDSIDTGDLHVSNFDFQFRNFIGLSATKTALIDWDSTRISTYEIEHCVAYMWLLMWENRAWQHEFLRQSKIKFKLREEIFRAAILICAVLVPTGPWKNIERLRNVLLCTLETILDDDKFNDIWTSESLALMQHD